MSSVNPSNQVSHPPGGGDTLDAGFTKVNAHWHEYEGETATNRTGGQVVLGDVCAWDAANDTSLVSDDTVGSLRTFAVAQGTIANGSPGEFTRAGVAQVKAQGTITRGEYIRKSATAKAAESTGVAQATAGGIPAGTIGVALTTAAGGFCLALLFGQTIAPAPPAINYAFNADLEIRGAGDGAPPTGWTMVGAGAVASKDTTTGHWKTGTSSAGLQRAGTDCYYAQDVSLIPDSGPPAWWQNRQVTAGAWVRATVASRARIGLNDGVGSSFSAYHTGGSSLEWLTVTRTLSGSATKVEIRLQVDTGNTTAQFDSAVLVVGASVSDFLPSSWRGRTAILWATCANVTLSTTVTNYFGNGIAPNGTESTTLIPVPFRGVARNLFALLTLTASPGSYTLTLRKNATTSTALAVTVTATQASREDAEVEFAKGDTYAIESVPASSPGTVTAVVMIEYEEVPAGI